MMRFVMLFVITLGLSGCGISQSLKDREAAKEAKQQSQNQDARTGSREAHQRLEKQ